MVLELTYMSVCAILASARCSCCHPELAEEHRLGEGGQRDSHSLRRLSDGSELQGAGEAAGYRWVLGWRCQSEAGM